MHITQISMQSHTPPVYEYPCPHTTGWDRYFPEGKGYKLPESHGDVALTFQRFMEPEAPKLTESDTETYPYPT